MKVIFLDRDGVICRFRLNDYAKNWQEFQFLPEAFSGLKRLSEAGYNIVVISNQAGVGKGIYSEAALQEITRRMLAVLASKNIRIAAVHYCLHTDQDNCDCRKPKPGMILQAARKFGLSDLSRCFFVGDAEVDILAGKNAGTRTILVLSGKTQSSAEIENWTTRPDFIASNLSEAAEIVLKKDGENCGRI